MSQNNVLNYVSIVWRQNLQLIFKAGSVVHNELEMKWISVCTEDEEVFIKMYNVSVSLQSLSVVLFSTHIVETTDFLEADSVLHAGTSFMFN